jgi:hypothetical protein
MRIILGLLAVLTAFPAFAQTAPPPAAPPTASPPAGAPQGNIEERARRQLSTPSERDRQDSLMTGDTDILLLRRTPLFTLTASGDVTYTSNAALSPTDVRADGIGQASLRSISSPARHSSACGISTRPHSITTPFRERLARAPVSAG